MIPQTLETAIFKKRLAQSLQTEQLEMTTLKVANTITFTSQATSPIRLLR